MCLDKLLPITQTKGVGYKMLIKDNGLYKTGLSVFSGEVELPIDRTVSDRKRTLIRVYPSRKEDGNKIYKTGFHVYLNKKDALTMCGNPEEVVCKVRFTKVVAQGLEGGFPVIVARRVKNLGEDKQMLNLDICKLFESLAGSPIASGRAT